MTDIVEQARKRSVTEEDASLGPFGGFSNFGNFYYLGVSAQGMLGLPAYWTPSRDYTLRNTVYMETMWSSAIYKAITKQAALSFTVKDSGDSQLRVERGQKLFLDADAVKSNSVGWVAFLNKHLRDWLLTDNGVFVEVIRATNAAGSRILGIAHLDSCRCVRTGDPDEPVVYRDRRGAYHILKAHQVLMASDMPDPSETFNGVGLCAASRAWNTIKKLAAVEQYFLEKVSGSRNTAIHILSGISDKSLQDALATADQEQARKGRVNYRGALVIPVVNPIGAALITIPLSEIPDGFDPELERKDAYLRYANAIGVPVQDIQPLSGQGLGTGQQAVIQAEAAEGYGLAAWRKWWEQTANEFLLPSSTTFAFSTNDIRDQKATAEVQKMRADTRKIQVETGEISAAQALQMAVDSGDVPKEFLAHDETPGGQLTDTEKPLDDATVVEAQRDESAIETPAEEASADLEAVETKATEIEITPQMEHAALLLIQQELPSARRRYRKATAA